LNSTLPFDHHREGIQIMAKKKNKKKKSK